MKIISFFSSACGVSLLILTSTAWAVFPPLALELVAEGQFNAPTTITHASDASGRLFIADQRGTIHILADGAVLPSPFLDISGSLVSERPGFDERGLLGLAFHPDYTTPAAPGEGRFYIYYSAPSPDAPGTTEDPVDHMSVVAEFRVSAGDPNTADAGSERVLLTFDQPQFNHDAGQLAFGPDDGWLYIGTGDGGSANDNNAGHTGGSTARPTNALGNSQDRTKLLGKILRIDPLGLDGPEGRYGIPTANPFVGEGGGVRGEIFAYGLRNPWRFSFDDGPGGTNRLFCADVGQGNVEEVNLIVAGGNYGWRNKEGVFTPDFSIDAPALAGTVVDPIAQYAHPGVTIGTPALPEIGISVTGGFVYRGSAIPSLQGKYVFADWSTGFGSPDGTLLGLEETSPGVFDLSVLDILGGNPVGRYIPAFGKDEQGELYVATKTSLAPSAPDPATGLPAGQLFRIIAPPDPVVRSLAPQRDNVIFSENGSLSNGSGPHLFAGRTNTGSLRRSLVAFDLTSVPVGSTVTAATLNLQMSKSISAAVDVGLHRVTKDWGESGSNSGTPGGGGAPAQIGDATWTHAFFNTVSWTSGGEFAATASAIASVGGIGQYAWASGGMTDDAQAWLDGTEPNHGWLLRGDESSTSAKRFESSENGAAANRPSLVLSYVPPALLTHRQVWERRFYPVGTFLDQTGDDDSDAITLLHEYAWDLDPTIRESASDYFSVVVDQANDRVDLGFVRDPRATDLTYILEVSGDLMDWSPLVTSAAGGAAAGTGFLSESVDLANPELFRISAQDSVAPSAGDPRFYRLRVVRP